MKCLSSSLLYVLFLIFHSQVSCSSSSSPSSSTSSSWPRCHTEESSALLQLKSSFSIATTSADYCDYYYYGNLSYSDKKTTSWNENTDCCTWDGVTCDGVTGHVIGLNLSCSWIQGTIGSNSSLFFLRHLQRLDLSFNDFSGSPILPEFGQFKNMTHLALAHSNFSGNVPLQISHLSKLVNFQLGDYYGESSIRIGPATAKALVHNLTKLRELQLRGVNMSRVPLLFLMNLSSSLTTLDLSCCELHGKFPENVFQLPKLQVLYLFWNDALTGSFPKSNWSNSLRELDLSLTRFSVDTLLLKNARSLSHLSLSGCHFVGSYTTLLDNLTHIISLDLSSNYFGGQIPWSSLNLNRLHSLDLSYNNFTGQIPEVISANSTQNFSSYDSFEYFLTSAPSSLKTLSLYSNFLNGTLPSWIFALPYLTKLWLGNNLFTGQIEEFQSTSLENLFLGQNKLHGLIPRSIFQNLNLVKLDLSSNNFTGHLELGLLSELKELFILELSSNNLSLSFNSPTNHTFDNLWSLGLSSCNISEFPSFFRYSKSLDTLDLSRNQIKGSVPTWLWELGKDSLYNLNLSHNFLTYIEPLHPLNNLQLLDIRSNLFSGPLPNILSPSLFFYSVSNNRFEGKIPTTICNLEFLQVLDLSYNDLNGNMPQCLGNFSQSLSDLDLRRNKLYGTIPTTFAHGNSLRSLNLNGNQLEGQVPRSLVHCRNLEVLDLGNNLLNDTFPNWLESLPMLQVLVLRANRFHGSIGHPNTGSPFRDLRIMDLSYNEFNGALPTTYFQNFKAMMNAEKAKLEFMGDHYYQDSVMVTMKGFNYDLVKIQTILTIIDFSSNNFTGGIPELIGRLESLKGLNFSHNKLSGFIPSSLGNLTNLEWLDLCSNELVGKIPTQLADLTSLSFLNLSRNKLEGPIPSGPQFNTFGNDSYIGDSGLCGFPLSKSCSNDEAQQDQGDDEEHEEGMLDWKVVMMGYGSGLVIGISVGYMVLFNRSFDCWLMKKLGRERRHISIAPLRGRRRYHKQVKEKTPCGSSAMEGGRCCIDGTIYLD